MQNDHSIASASIRGDAFAVLQRTLDGPSQEVAIPDLEHVVAALTALGRLQEAETLFRNQEKALGSEQRAACRYFLALAYTRRSAIAKARPYLGANLQVRKDARFAESLFYIHHGLAFHRFFQGRLLPAKRAASLALRLARQGDRGDWVYLAAELLGQIHFIMGEPIQALALMEEALREAENIGHVFAPRLLAMQLAQHRARLGTDHQGANAELVRLLNKLQKDDVFGRLSLLLERARLLAAQGHRDQAKTLLNEAYELLLVNKSRRYEMTRALRMADLLSQGGDLHLALQQLDLASAELDPSCDLLYEVEILVRRSLILEKLDLREALKVVKRKLRKQAKRCGASVERMRPPDLRTTARTDALNHRQIDILRLLKEKEFVEVKTVRELFQISEITACRDLSELTRHRLLERVGRARATKYRLRGRE